MKNKNTLNHQLISSKELARRVGYTNDYISRLCRYGKVEGEKIGNTWYVDELSLNKFISSQESQNKNWNGELSQKRKIEYQGDQLGQGEDIKSPYFKFSRIAIVLSGIILVASVSTAFSMETGTMSFLLNPAQVLMSSSTQSAASILSDASSIFTQASISAVDGVKTAFTSLSRAVSSLSSANASSSPSGIDSKLVTVKSTTNSIQPLVNKINNTQSTLGTTLLGINTSATINGALRVLGSSVLSDSLGVGGSATISGALRVLGSSVLSDSLGVGGSATVNGAFRVLGSSVLNGRLQTLGGIDTNNTDINAGSGRVFASNIVNSITAGENVVIAGTLQNPIISSFASSSIINNITQVTEVREIRIGGGSGGPRVTSVGMSVPSFLSVSGSPITSSGSLDISYSGSALPIDNGGTGLSSIADAAILATNSNNVLTAVTAGASQSIRRNAGNTAWESFTPSSGGSGVVGSGTTGQFPYYSASGTTVTATSSIFLATNGNIGIGTTTPGSLFSLGNTGANTINISATATSTFGSGINILTGCFSVNGTCLPTSSGTVTSLAATYPLLTTGGTGAITISTAFGTTTANSWSQLQTFNGGVFSPASSTIGDGAQNGGLTINGGATTTGASYFVGNIGVGIQPSTRALDVLGTTRLSSTLTLQNISSCAGSSALQTDGSGNVSCGSIASLGISTAGGWSTNSTGSVTLATTTDRVGVGATTTPYAKLTVLSGATATTTLALVPVVGQTANIIDIYNTSGALSSVFTAAGSLGIGTTTPGSLLSLGNTGANTVNISATATSTFGSGLSIRTGCFAINGTCLSAAGLGGLTNVTGTWPIISSGGATPNITWGGLSTSSPLAAGGALLYATGVNTVASAATSTLAVGTGLTSSGTLGYQVGGTNSSISFAAIAANSLWANATGGSAVPTAIATSSLGINFANLVGTASLAQGGTGQTSFAQGWLHSSGSTLTSSTSPTVNYITATSTTATSTFAGGVRVTGGGVTINTLNCSAYLNSGKLTVGADGSVTCSDDNGGAGGGISTYLGLTDTPSSYTANAIQYANAGATALTQSSSLTFDGTKFITNYASTTAFTATGSTYLATAGGSVGIGTTSPGSLLSVQGVANFTTGTTTFYGNGINLAANQCYAVNGVCLPTSSGAVTSLAATYPLLTTGSTGSITISTAFGTTTANTFSALNIFNANASTTQLTSTGSAYLATTGGSVGIGTTTPWGLLSVNPNGITGPSFVIGSSTATNFIVTSGGNIGIGTTTPGSLLSLGNTGTNTINISATATSTFGSGLAVRGGGLAINTLDCSGYINSGKLTVGADGSVKCSDDNGGAGGGISTYLGLTDTPSSYTANAIQYANAGATALTQSSSLTFDGTKLITNYASTTALTVSGQGYFATASTTNLIISSVRSALVLTGSTGLAGAYGGATCPGALIQSINADGTVTCASSGASTGGGSVTSVAQTVPAFLSISGSPITTTGTLAITLSGTALPVSSGGTGQITFTSGQLLYGNGTNALSSVATSSISVGTGISVTSGTLGSQIGGTNVTLGIANNALTLAQLPQIAAGFILGNNTGATANVTSFATSSLFGTGTGGQVLAWNNGVPQWVATSSINNGVTSVTGTWPIISSGGATPNITWGGLSTSSPLAAGGALLYATGVNTVASAATSTLAVGTGLTSSGTLGYQVGGTNSSISFAAIAANSLWANATGGSAVPTAIATSSLGINFANIIGTASLAQGGTGQTSFAQGWLHSSGSTLTSSTSPTVNYITATSTTATSTFAGGVRVTGGGVTINTLNCSAYLNSGKLTVGADGSVTCSDDNGGAGGGISTYLGLTDTPSSYTANAIQYANPGATALTQSSSLTFDGTKFITNYASTTAFTATGSTYLATAGGSVGIGTTSPGSTLSVAGAGYFAGNLNLDSFSSYQLAGQTVLSATSTTGNTLVGLFAGENIVSISAAAASGISNTALGYEALRYATSTDYNTAVGYQALRMSASGTADNSGIQNTAIGYQALVSNTTGYDNTASGVSALYFNTTGYDNTASGVSALYFNTTGYFNTASGVNALLSNTTGYFNTASGVNALYYNTTGYENTANGVRALVNNTTGYDNTANGVNALYYNQSATSSTAVGAYAAQGTAAYNNQGGVYLGYQSGYSAATNSDYNTLVGYQSGYGITTGARNVFLGNSTIAASYNQVTIGSNNIAIGNDVAVPSATASNQLVIGNLIYGTGLDGTGSTLSTGKIGIGTTTPYSLLSLSNSATTAVNTPLFTIASTTGGTSTSTLMTVLANGNVGIGTAAPAYALDINGGSGGNYPLNAVSSSYQLLRLESTGGGSEGWLSVVLANSLAPFRIVTSNSSPITLDPGGNERVRVTSAGNFGIGTTTPGSTLSVAGAGYFAGNLNLDSFSSYQLAGQTVLSATSTTFNTLVGILAGANIVSTSTANTSGLYNTALGYEALRYATSTDQNTAVGYQALRMGTGADNSGSRNTAVGYMALTSNTTGANNVAFGQGALTSNTTGTDNTAVGRESLGVNITGSNNIAIGWRTLYNNNADNNSALGYQALINNTTGSNNVAVGRNTLFTNTTGTGNSAFGYLALNFNNSATSTTAIGAYAAQGTAAYNNQGGTYLGYQSGYSAATNSDYNTLVGYQSGYGITTGSNNIWIGTATSSTAIANLTTGSQNILIGNNISLPSATDSGQLNIGNIIFGTSITGTGSTLSTGNIGIGTTSPATLLEVGGTTANVTLDGYKSCTGFTSNANGLVSCTASDQRLKQNIVPIDGSSGLAAINTLNPVSFYWKAEADRSAQQQYGLIAQQVQNVFPNLVATSSPTILTPDGTLSVNYEGLVSPMIRAIQQLDARTNFIQNAATSTTLTIDVVGNVGIGTTTPNHALTVAGDVGATGFINTSTREAKADIAYATASSTEDRLNQLVNLKVATYRYKIENQNDPLRLGFIAEDVQTIAPEILSPDGKGVDLYKLATFTLSGVQALAAKQLALTARVDSLESRMTKLENGSISTASGSPISFSTTSLASALDSFGVLIQKGIAQFNTLVFRQLVASKDADGTSSAGSVIILAGNTVAQVNNSLVLPSTKVFITFNSQITGSWWVSDKAPGSFRVVLSVPQATDVSFDYFLVQTEGQIATSTPSGTVPQGSSVSQSNGPDTVPPVITFLGDNPVRISVGSVFVEPGVTITDAVDGTAPYVTFINGVQQVVSSSSIDTTNPTTYIITYSATDTAGNFSTAVRSVIVGGASSSPQVSGSTETVSTAVSTTTSNDTTPPTVMLIGAAAMQINIGDVFTDPSATATDDIEGDLTATIVVTGVVDSTTAGLYTLTYSATDAAGNTSAVSRVVTVAAPA